MSFNPNWICRAELEVVEIEPALLVLTTAFGNEKWASLKRLKNSERPEQCAHAAILVLAIGRFRPTAVKEVVRIQLVVADELECRVVQLVRARFVVTCTTAPPPRPNSAP